MNITIRLFAFLKKFPRKRYSLFGFFAVILVGLGVFCLSKIAPEKRLPALAYYRQLPAQFNTVLVDRYREAKARRSGSPTVRSLARLYQANQLDHEARGCYEWLADDGRILTAQDHYFLADIALNEGDLPLAKSHLKSVLAADSGYQPARLRLAAVLSKSGDEEEARKEYELILAQEPNQPEASVALARLDLQKGNDALAIRRLEQLLSVHREAVAGAALLAQIMARRGENTRAAALTEWSLLRPPPASPDPWLDTLLEECYSPQRLSLRAEEMINVGQVDGALAILSRLEQMDRNDSHVHLLRGWVADRAGRKVEAIEEYRRAMDSATDPERVATLLAACLVNLNRRPEAIAVVDLALQKTPGSTTLLSLQSNMLFQQGDYKRARSLLSELLKTAPFLYDANMTLANLLWSSGERDEAVVVLTRVAAGYPADVASRGLLGQYYLEKGDLMAAIRPLEEAMVYAKAGSPPAEELKAMLVLACLREGLKKASVELWLEAAFYFEKAGYLSPKGAEALVQLAEKLKEKQKFQAAAEVLKRLGKIQPDNPTIELTVGDFLYQAGDTLSAQAHWSHALELAAPEDAPLREALSVRLKGKITPDLFN